MIILYAFIIQFIITSLSARNQNKHKVKKPIPGMGNLWDQSKRYILSNIFFFQMDFCITGSKGVQHKVYYSLLRHKCEGKFHSEAKISTQVNTKAVQYDSCAAR